MKRLLALGFLGVIFLSALAPASKANAIVDGEIANQYSWSVAFVHKAEGKYAGKPLNQRIACSGALIFSQWVLTAAHCQLPRDSIQVVIGRDDLSQGDGEKRYLPAADQAHFRHPSYVNVDNNGDGVGDNGAPYDVMLVKLDQPSTKQPISIAGPGATAYWGEGSAIRLYGYGTTPQLNHVLRRAHLTVNHLNRNHYTMHAYAHAGCVSDSGGPITTSTPYGPMIVGVYSGYIGGTCSSTTNQVIEKVGYRSSESNSPLYTWLENFFTYLPTY